MFLETEEHRHYLGDARRTELYSRALKELVTPANAVIDLGAGTGILGLLAARAGARRVFAIDGGGIIELARQIAAANGLSDSIKHHHALSTEISLPEKADIVVADQIGRFGLECGLWQSFVDARKRLLKPDGICIPNAITLHVAPVECPEHWREAHVWAQRPAGFDFSPALPWATNTPRPVNLKEEQLLSEPHAAHEVRLDRDDPRAIRIEHRFNVSRSGTLHGIAGWFSVQLSPSVRMTNSPLSPERIQREQSLFLIERPVALAVGDAVTLALTIQPLEDTVSWRVATRTKKGESSSSQSTFLARLTSPEELARTRPDAAPVLTPIGEARRLVLELCDGKRTVAAIELQVAGRFPRIFSAAINAAPFVAETLARYSR